MDPNEGQVAVSAAPEAVAAGASAPEAHTAAVTVAATEAAAAVAATATPQAAVAIVAPAPEGAVASAPPEAPAAAVTVAAPEAAAAVATVTAAPQATDAAIMAPAPEAMVRAAEATAAVAVVAAPPQAAATAAAQLMTIQAAPHDPDPGWTWPCEGCGHGYYTKREAEECAETCWSKPSAVAAAGAAPGNTSNEGKFLIRCYFTHVLLSCLTVLLFQHLQVKKMKRRGSK